MGQCGSAQQLWLVLAFLCLLGRIWSSTALIDVLIPSSILYGIQDVAVGSPLSLAAFQMGDCPAGQEAGVKCARVRIPGQSRLSHLSKWCHITRVNVTEASVIPGLLLWNKGIEVCLHWNESLPLGSCNEDSWHSLAKGMWTGVMSPFETRYLDIRVSNERFDTISISLKEEFQAFRAAFLVAGFSLLSMAPCLSRFVPLYYTSGMAMGVLLVILFLLYQGMKMLPTGRKSSWNIFIFGSLAGLGSLMLGLLSAFVKSYLRTLGLTDDLGHPAAVLALTVLTLVGAGLGFFIVRRFVLTPEGHLDASTAGFVDWSLRTIAAILLTQSSYDAPLQLVALAGGAIWMLVRNLVWQAVLEWTRRVFSFAGALVTLLPSFPSSFRSLSKISKTNIFAAQPSNAPLPEPSAPGSGLTAADVVGGRFFSSYHHTPRGPLSSKDADEVARVTTKWQLGELYSSQEFCRWIAANADRLAIRQDSSKGKEMEEDDEDDALVM